MFLLEHDAKSLLAPHGAPAPAGVLLDGANLGNAQLPPAPWGVKAQIAAGRRGKAALIRTAKSRDELQSQLRAIVGAVHQGMTVQACRVESQVTNVEEAYLSFMLDPVTAGVRVMLAAHGGVEIEALAATPGALAHGSHGGYAAKKAALEKAGATVFGCLDDLTQGIAAWHAARVTV